MGPGRKAKQRAGNPLPLVSHDNTRLAPTNERITAIEENCDALRHGFRQLVTYKVENTVSCINPSEGSYYKKDTEIKLSSCLID